MSIIQGNAKQGSTRGFYDFPLEQSLRFNDDDSAYLSKTFTTPTDNQNWTWSGWIKLSTISTAARVLLQADTNSVDVLQMIDHKLSVTINGATTTNTTMLLRDPSAWYHIVWNYNGSNSKLYVNGELQITVAKTGNTKINNASYTHYIGTNSTGRYFDGYMAEVNFIDGTALDADSFGETKSGVWIPKEYSGSYGTNGFHLEFAGNANDSSGNGNNWTANNIASNDYVPDSPTNNFCTWNPLSNTGTTLANGNLDFSGGSSSVCGGTLAVTSGKWYWECSIQSTINPSNPFFLGFASANTIVHENYDQGVSIYSDNGTNNLIRHRQNNSNAQSITIPSAMQSFSIGDVIQFAYDGDTGKIWVGVDNTWADNSGGTTGNPSAGTNPTFTLSDTDIPMTPIKDHAGPAWSGHANFGQLDYEYTPPTDYLALSTANLPEPTISPADDAEPRDYFETFLYTGNGTQLQVGDVIKKPADTTTISNSLIFNDGDSAYLNKTFSSNQTDSEKGTLSFWIKRGVISADQMFFSVTDSNVAHYFRFNANDTITFYLDQSAAGSDELTLTTTRTIKDNDWHHLFVKMDMSQASVSDKLKMWIDGVLVGDTPSQTGSAMTAIRIFKNGASHSIGRYDFNNTQFFDGYLAEFHAVDGTAHEPTDFGNFDANGIWIPKTVTGITYGTNGFYLDFSDNTSTTTLGEDQTANGNDWTLNNFATTDQVSDSPTDNFATLNSPSSSNITYSEGNLKYQHTGSWTTTEAYSTIKIPAAQKFYFEVYQDSVGGAGTYCGVGITSNTTTSTTPYNGVGGWVYLNTGAINHDSTTLSTESSYTTGDTIGVAVDRENGTVKFYKNNTLEYTVSDLDISTGDLYFTVFAYTGTMTTNFGQRAFTYTPPSGFVALSENNITVNDQNLESPDFVWIKNRDQGDSHQLYDSVRGVQKVLLSDPDTNPAEADAPNGLLDFNANGFTIGSQNEVNTLNEDYVAWTWKAGGSATLNDTGTIDSQVSANTESGFSIVTYTGTGATSSGVTIGHGLGATPAMIITKCIDTPVASGGDYWSTWHKDLGGNYGIWLNLTNGRNIGMWDGYTNIDADVFSPPDLNYGNSTGKRYVNYVFAEVEGFSKFGSYTGNGNPDGTFVYTGFRPAFVIAKASSTSGYSWNIIDTARDTYNTQGLYLFANTSGAEGSGSDVDILSNGFKLRNAGAGVNGTGITYIYMAFAENPFKYSNAR